MEFLRKVLSILSAEMIPPTVFGWFHFLFIGFVFALTIFLCIRFKNSSDKVYRRIVLISWIIMVVLEVYKQFVFSYSFEDAKILWDYDWESFPYQLCSTPLYVLPFIAFMKDSKFRDCLISFIATFSFFGGFATFCYPANVFIELIGINIQTMVHHGLQIAIGVFSIVYFRKRFNIKYFLKSLPVFCTLVSFAFLLNEVFVLAYGTGEKFNMFYISRHEECILPILDVIYKQIHYVPFVIIYVLGFMLVAAIIYFIARGIILLVNKIKAKKCYA